MIDVRVFTVKVWNDSRAKSIVKVELAFWQRDKTTNAVLLRDRRLRPSRRQITGKKEFSAPGGLGARLGLTTSLPPA